MGYSIAWDLDGVFIDIVPAIQRALKQLYPHVEWDTRRKFKITTTPPLSNTKIWKAVDLAINDWKHIGIFHGSDMVTEAYYDATERPIRFITARPLRCVEETHRLVKRFCHVPHEIIFADSDHKLMHVLDTDVFVEDRRRTALHMINHGLMVFLVDTDYNQLKNAPDRLIRIPDIAEMLKYAPMFRRSMKEAG